MIDGPGTFEYIYTDQLGAPRAVTSSAGTTIWTWDFDRNPFGEASPADDPDGNGAGFTQPLRFPGQYFDSETSLHFNAFRDYEPSTGRYIENDPLGIRGGVTPYNYVLANPTKYIDLFGLVETKCIDNWDPDYYETKTNVRKRTNPRIIFQYTIFDAPTPEGPGWPSPRDPRNIKPIDFIGWYIDFYRVTITKFDILQQYVLWQNGRELCYHWDDCGNLLSWDESPTFRQLGPFWRQDGVDFDEDTKFLYRLHFIDFPFEDFRPPPRPAF
jgi:RHS repeat-associated protein